MVDQKPVETSAVDNSVVSTSDESAVWLAKWSILASVVCAIAAVLALPRLRIVLIGPIVATLTPLAIWWLMPTVRRWPRWNNFVPYLAALLVVASTVAVITASRSSSQHVTYVDRDQPPPKAHENLAARIAIGPPFGGSGVGRCLTVQLSGRVPKGERLVVAHQLEPHPQWYFKPATAGTNNNIWTVSLTLGSHHMSKRSNTITIYAVLMSNWLANYLEFMQTFQNIRNTFWVSPKWPPSALKVGQVTVVRVIHKGPKSCPQ
jgi:hypothetical protein